MSRHVTAPGDSPGSREFPDRQGHRPAARRTAPSTIAGPAPVLQLQTLAGNRVVAAMLAQRARTEDGVVETGPAVQRCGSLSACSGCGLRSAEDKATGRFPAPEVALARCPAIQRRQDPIGRVGSGLGVADGATAYLQRCGDTGCSSCTGSGGDTNGAVEQTDPKVDELDGHALQRSLDPANQKAWDWYDKESHRKDASFLKTVEAAKGSAGDVTKALAAGGVPKTDEERKRFEDQVKTLVRLNAVAMVGEHRGGLARRQSQFESMLATDAAGTPSASTSGPGAPTTANTAAADTAAAIRGAADVVRKLTGEQEGLVKLKETAAGAVRLNAGPETIPSEYDTLVAAAEPRSTPMTMQSVLTAKDRMEGLAWGTKKLRLMELGNDLVRLRERQISGVRQGLASVYDAFPIFATMPATFPATGKNHESSTARKVAVGIGTASMLATPFAPLALWLAKDEFAKDRPPDDATLLAEARRSFEKLLNNTDEAIVKIGSGGMNPLELPGAVTATRSALPEALRPELDRVKQEHEVAKFTEEMVMALGLAVLTGLTGGLAGLGATALAATAGVAAAGIGVQQVAGQAKDALDRQTVGSASTSPDKSLLGVSAPSMFEWAVLGVTAALTVFDLAMVAKELAALKPRFHQEPHLGGQPKEPAGGSGAGGEPTPPKGNAESPAPSAAGSAEARVLEAGRGDAVPSLEQIDSELGIVERSQTRPSTATGYQDEVELGNGHIWRRDANDNWCRFSARICVPAGRGRSKVKDGVVRSEQDLDKLVEASKPRIDQPPPSVTTPEDTRLWELYTSYFDERVTSMRADLRSELGATKRELPLTFDGFRDRYTKNPDLIAALRGRLSQGETGNLIADITSGKAAQNLGISKVPNPGPAELVYPDFVFKRANGDGFSAVTQKRRDFTALSGDDLRKTVMGDLREGLEKYVGSRYVRRPGLDQTGKQIRIDELILNYDVRGVPESLRAQIKEIGASYEGVDVKIGFFEF